MTEAVHTVYSGEVRGETCDVKFKDVLRFLIEVHMAVHPCYPWFYCVDEVRVHCPILGCARFNLIYTPVDHPVVKEL